MAGMNAWQCNAQSKMPANLTKKTARRRWLWVHARPDHSRTWRDCSGVNCRGGAHQVSGGKQYRSVRRIAK